MNRRHHILLVEDNPGDVALLRDMIEGTEIAIELDHVETIAAARDALSREGDFDAILLDLRLPDGEGIACLRAIQQVAGEAAILVLTGIGSEALALECIEAGAQDYINKSDVRPYGLRRAIGYAVARMREASARQRVAELQSQLSHAQKLDTLGRLSAGIAHDLGNTLQPIFNVLGALDRRVTDAENRQMLELIATASRRAKDLVREILEFTRKSGGETERVLLDQFVLAAAPMLSAGIAPSIMVRARASPVGPIRVNRTGLYQVLLNLVTNSAKAIGDRAGTIDVRVTEHSGRVVLSVADDGGGMASDVRQRIFEPFFTTRGETGGTGLGLSMVKNIVEQASGTISVENVPGQGACFTISFPIVNAQVPEVSGGAR